jgi:hypothetical protein
MARHHATFLILLQADSICKQNLFRFGEPALGNRTFLSERVRVSPSAALYRPVIEIEFHFQNGRRFEPAM